MIYRLSHGAGPAEATRRQNGRHDGAYVTDSRRSWSDASATPDQLFGPGSVGLRGHFAVEPMPGADRAEDLAISPAARIPSSAWQAPKTAPLPRRGIRTSPPARHQRHCDSAARTQVQYQALACGMCWLVRPSARKCRRCAGARPGLVAPPGPRRNGLVSSAELSQPGSRGQRNPADQARLPRPQSSESLSADRLGAAAHDDVPRHECASVIKRLIELDHRRARYVRAARCRP